MADRVELLSREFPTGTSVTNCVAHMGLSILERDDDCRLCRTDIRNVLSRALRANEWLNEWKEDATAVFRVDLGETDG